MTTGALEVSRRGHKTVNLPTHVCEIIDRLVEAGATTALSRDEFVRQAIYVFAATITANGQGRNPWPDVTAATDELRRRAKAAQATPPLQETSATSPGRRS